MFPLPPDIPVGKSGNEISFLNPITETPSTVNDYGIVDAALFSFSPNESKKFNDAVMNVYNYINLVDAIKLRGAKCYLNWESEIANQIGIIHSEFFIGAVSDRTQYVDRTASPDLIYNTPIGATPPTGIAITVAETPITVGLNAQINPSITAPPTNIYVQSCSPVTWPTTAKYPPEARKWIHHLRGLHPLIDDQITELSLFKPVSEHMGENVITYNSDTAAVDIDDWSSATKTVKNIINPTCVFAYGTPHCLREIIRERMIAEQPDEINFAWTSLNSLMANNLPRETKVQTALGTGVWSIGTRDSMSPHGLIMINDTHHWIDRIDPIKLPTVELLFAYLQEATELINHMYPLINNVISEKRNYLYEPILTKTVNNKWIIYEIASPPSPTERAPLDVGYALGVWGYQGTQVVEQQWPVSVGLAVEETFPRKKTGSGTFEADMFGNKLKGTITDVIDNDLFIPEVVDLPLA